MPKVTTRTTPIMIRMRPSEERQLKELTEYLGRAIPWASFTQSDVVRYALAELSKTVNREAFAKSMLNRASREPIK